MSDIFQFNYPSNTNSSDPFVDLLATGDDLSSSDAIGSQSIDTGFDFPNQSIDLNQSPAISNDYHSYSPYAPDHLQESPALNLSALHPALSNYTDLQKIGAGSQGTMLRAVAHDGTKVAIKVFDIQKTDGLKSLELFEREIDTLKNINVPGVPKFIEDIRTMQYLYLIEEYIDAPSLEKRMQNGQRFRLNEIIQILSNAAKILDELYAYIPPIVHRDIKPANLLIDDALNVWLVDFGVVASKAPESLAMTFAGTAGYLAPEQLYGRATPASDIFSLGVTIAHLVTQKAPCDMTMDGVKLDINKYIPSNVPAWFIHILNKMIASDPADRFQNARQILGQIEDAQIADVQAQNINITATSQQIIPSNISDNSSPSLTANETFSLENGIAFHSEESDAYKELDSDKSYKNIEHSEPLDASNHNENVNALNTAEKPLEVQLKEHIKDIYQPFLDIVSDYNWYILWIPIILLSLLLMPFFIYYAAFEAEFSEFFLYWVPAVYPFIYALGGIVAKESCIKDADFEEKCRSYKNDALKLNQIYATELRLPESDKANTLPHFLELSQLVDGSSPCYEAQAPLTIVEEKRLDDYIEQQIGPYPCLAFEPYTQKNYIHHIIQPIFITLIAIAIIVFTMLLSALPTVWTIISSAIYFLSFLGYFKFLKYIFTKYIKRISNPDYIDAYQLYVRRFVNECRAPQAPKQNNPSAK